MVSLHLLLMFYFSSYFGWWNKIWSEGYFWLVVNLFLTQCSLIFCSQLFEVCCIYSYGNANWTCVTDIQNLVFGLNKHSCCKCMLKFHIALLECFRRFFGLNSTRKCNKFMSIFAPKIRLPAFSTFYFGFEGNFS